MYKESLGIDAVETTQSSLQNLDQHLYLNFQTYPELNMEEPQ